MLPAPPTPEPIEYSLTLADGLRLREEWQTRGAGGNRNGLLVGQVFLTAFAVIRLGTDLDRLRWPHHDMITGMTFVWDAAALLLALAVLALGAKPELLGTKPWRTRRIVFNSAGIELTENGVSQRIKWNAIGEAYDLPLSIGLARRDDAKRPLRIPKTSLADGGAALWSYLEVSLTGRRPAIRDLGFAAPNHLINVKDQYLTDQGVTA